MAKAISVRMGPNFMVSVSAPVVSIPAKIFANPWLVLLARRFGQFVFALFVLVTAVFVMVHAIPGDPVRNALGDNVPSETVETKIHELGLDRPLWSQYLTYVRDLAKGDLGNSLSTGLPVRSMLAQELPSTITIAVSAFVVVLLLSIPLGMLVGIVSANGRRRGVHIGFASTTGFFSVLPEFVLCVFLQFLFAVTFKTLPVAGQGGFESYVLPVVALAAGPAALLARIVRVETQRVLGEEYMRVARSKRLPRRLMYLRHALPNLLAATLTVSGLILGGLLAGTVLVEKIFAWPGVGAQMVSSTLGKDFPVVQALGLFFGGAVLVINLVVDIVIAVIDPRTAIKER
ncbi:ABC transporter permease [Streptomyces sp. NPDC004752]